MEERIGAVILAGGKGSRMGNVDKAGLLYRGEPFAAVIGRELDALGVPCFFSAAEPDDRRPKTSPAVDGEAVSRAPQSWFGWDWPLILDSVKDDRGFIGPMGGIYSCLKETGLDGLFFVSCDMPLFRRELAVRLLAHLREGEKRDALVWRTRDGRIHPICGYYSKGCMPVLEQFIRQKNYRMRDFLAALSCKTVETAAEHIPDRWFNNVNTPEAYEGLTTRRPPVFAVSGRKNSGKTTLLEGLVRELSARGVRAAVIKHDGHDFEPDVPGTDSFRMKAAGACGTVVYSKNRYCIVKETSDSNAEDFFEYFPDADILLLEGQKASDYPKIEIMRSAVSLEPVCRPETVRAYVTDWDGETGELLELLISCIDGRGV